MTAPDNRSVAISLLVRPSHPSGALKRVGEPVTVGVPFPKGLIAEAHALQLSARSGELIPIQCVVTQHWSDGSIRWALLTFKVTTDLLGTAELSLRVVHSRPHAEVAQSIQLFRDATEIRLDTGLITVRCEPTGGDLSVCATSSAKPWAVTVSVQDADGGTYHPVFTQAALESEGPLVARLRLTGAVRLPASRQRLGLEMLLEMFEGLPILAVAVTVHNPARARHPGGVWELGDKGSLTVRDVSIGVALKSAPSRYSVRYSEAPESAWRSTPAALTIYQDSSGGEHWQSRGHVTRDGSIWPRVNGYEVRAETTRRGLRSTPIVELSADEQILSLTTQRFWENFPKAVAANGQSLALHLFPAPDDRLHEIQGGERKRHDLHLCIGRDFITDEPLAWARVPLVVNAYPDWYDHCDVLPFFVPFANRSWPDELLASAVEGPSSFFAKRERADEYGWRHFGELHADHEAVAGNEDFVSHYNNQYDPISGFARQFMRTGDVRWYELMTSLARHVADIDIYHTADDKAAYNGGLFWHTYHYVDAGKSTHRSYPNAPGVPGGGPSAEHNYAEGLALHHSLTGDPDSRRAVFELADWVVALDDGRETVFKWLDSGRTGWASATGSLAYQGPGRGAGNSISTLLVASRLSGRACYLQKAEEIIHRCIHPDDQPDSLNLLDPEQRWSYTVFLQALGRYLTHKEELGERDDSHSYAAASLLTYARWMAKNEYFYLDKSEILEYPSETWAAQELRKAEVFVVASLRGYADERPLMRERAEYFFERSKTALQQSGTAALTRPLALVVSHAWSVPWMRSHSHAGAGTARTFSAPPRPVFVPQRIRAMRRAKLLALAIGGFVAAGMGWYGCLFDSDRGLAVLTFVGTGPPPRFQDHVAYSRLCRITRAGTPAATTYGGRGRVTTDPAPTIVLFPTSAITTAPLPIQQPVPIRTSCRSIGCS